MVTRLALANAVWSGMRVQAEVARLMVVLADMQWLPQIQLTLDKDRVAATIGVTF